MSTSNTPDLPSPGSPYAVAHGCLCPILDNAHGKGIYNDKEKPVFWINADCPIHGSESTGNPEHNTHQDLHG